jgi:hypothetical protein
VFLDARQYGDYACAWALFVLIGNLVALIAYLLARPPKSMQRRSIVGAKKRKGSGA